MTHLTLREWIEQFLPTNYGSAEVLYDLDLGILIPGHGITHVGVPHATKASIEEDESFDMLVIKGQFVPHSSHPYITLTLAESLEDYECYERYCQELQNMVERQEETK